MCLRIKNSDKIKVTRKPITVYKVLNNDNTPLFNSLPNDDPYVRRKIFKSDIIISCCEVENGLHSFTKLIQAKQYLNCVGGINTLKNMDGKYRLCEFEIPIGSQIIRGKWDSNLLLTDNGLDSIVSNQIIYKRIIKIK